MDPENQPQFNPKIPISEVLKQEQTGYTPSVPKKASLNDVVDELRNNYNDTNNPKNTVGTVNTNQARSAIPAGTGSAPAPSKIVIIKTYRSDAAEAVKSQQATVAKIAIAEDKQRRIRDENDTSTPKKKLSILLVTIVLVALGAAAIPSVQYILNQKKQEVPISTEQTVVPSDHQETVTIDNATRDDLLAGLDTLWKNIPTTSNIDSVKILEKIIDSNQKPTTQQLAPDVFAGLIGPNMPSALARSFDSQYMYGFDNSQGSKPFIIFKTSSYEQTFANMLRWETKMLGDLGPILRLDDSVIAGGFNDQVIMSKDVRSVNAADGSTAFLYGFLDNQTLIITTDPQTFQDINNRYIAAQFVQ